jgi:uncharacterized membrane protein
MATGTIPGWAHILERTIQWAIRHWLLFANGLILLYGGLPWLAPIAHATGHHTLGNLIFAIYHAFCHQIPQRSFFLFGYQVAYCHRETAMYTTLFIGGLLFGLVRNRIRPVSWRIGGLLMLPILLDGSTHLIDDLLDHGLRGGGDAIGTPNFWLRMITGALFAIAVLIALYPRLDRDLRAIGMVAPIPA